MKPAYAYLLLAALAPTAPPWRSAPIRRWKRWPTVVTATPPRPPNGRINLDARDGTGSRLG